MTFQVKVLLLIVVSVVLCVSSALVCAGEGTCSASRRQLIAGNWKMNTDLAGATALTSGLAELTKDISRADVEIAIFPPFPFIREVWKVGICYWKVNPKAC
jgi:hypothetical protein